MKVLSTGPEVSKRINCREMALVDKETDIKITTSTSSMVRKKRCRPNHWTPSGYDLIWGKYGGPRLLTDLKLSHLHLARLTRSFLMKALSHFAVGRLLQNGELRPCNKQLPERSQMVWRGSLSLQPPPKPRHIPCIRKKSETCGLEDHATAW